MISFVGAGPGDSKLITVRGSELLKDADIVIYAGSLVPKELLSYCREDADIYDSSRMSLEEVISVMKDAEASGKKAVRLHTGDPSIFGAIREQMDELSKSGITFEVVPGVSSFTAAAAALCAEYTLPGISQSVIITRMEGRTAVPSGEKLSDLARHGASMAVFLSAGMAGQVSKELLASGAYFPDTPAALVYKATHAEEKIVRCTVGSLEDAAASNGISRTALILVGDFLKDEGPYYEKSRLYDKDFTTGYRQGRKEEPVRCISFTEGGKKTGLKLKSALGEELCFKPFEEGMSLEEWTKEAFLEAKALVFIGAAGIAVRAVSPYLRGKALDPAVIVIDDRGENVIPILSGHIGGGNALAKRLAGILGCRAVITTSTDINGVFAIDTWAVENGMRIVNPERIKTVSSKLLRGEKVYVRCKDLRYVNYMGRFPEDIVVMDGDASDMTPDVMIGFDDAKNDSILHIAPSVSVGVGCRKGISFEKLRDGFERFCSDNKIPVEAVTSLASIDLKKDEEALCRLGRELGIGFKTFTARELNCMPEYEGSFSASDFVESVTGVDCVCERSAVKAAGAKELLVAKRVYDGVTFAAAVSAKRG
ncbi:MAG: precorrin-4 C(11)-methyltransferase [Lachnospiraceae bacterium]|nr:precorrin-4 C(11)-methyltransferase [Lachnospiraceae bacterium]